MTSGRHGGEFASPYTHISLHSQLFVIGRSCFTQCGLHVAPLNGLRLRHVANMYACMTLMLLVRKQIATPP